MSLITVDYGTVGGGAVTPTQVLYSKILGDSADSYTPTEDVMAVIAGQTYMGNINLKEDGVVVKTITRTQADSYNVAWDYYQLTKGKTYTFNLTNSYTNSSQSGVLIALL